MKIYNKIKKSVKAEKKDSQFVISDNTNFLRRDI